MVAQVVLEEVLALAAEVVAVLVVASVLEVQAAQAVAVMAAAHIVEDIITITDAQEDHGMFQCLEEQLLFQQELNHFSQCL